MTRKTLGAEIRLIQPGETITADWLNEVAAAAERVPRKPNDETTQEPEGEDGEGAADSKIGMLFVELTAFDNVLRTLTCKQVGVTAPNDLTVELTQIFAEASRGGISYTYSSINNRVADGTENQEITPPFVVGEQFYIAEELETGIYRFFGDGRMWAQV